jgi:hypothetical protein
MSVGATTFYFERAHTMEQISERLQEIAVELAADGDAIVSVSHTFGHKHPHGGYEFVVIGRPVGSLLPAGRTAVDGARSTGAV